jgi:O-acetyl-ADP-ribose deacetylase (regulator of RNase III)
MPGRHIGIVTGSLDRIRNVDVWVNSENTDLEMARCAELSVSALIRYLGAEKTAGRVTKDSIQDYLRIYSDGIAPGSVVRTEPGRLADRGVRLILHAATAFGEPGSGYSPIKNLPGCVTACLEEFTSFASEQDEGDKPRSILLPLFGTGTARGDLRSAANKLLETAVAFLHDRGEAATDVWFLAYSQRQLNVCRSVLDADRTLNRRPGTRNPYV